MATFTPGIVADLLVVTFPLRENVVLPVMAGVEDGDVDAFPLHAIAGTANNTAAHNRFGTDGPARVNISEAADFWQHGTLIGQLPLTKSAHSALKLRR